MTELDRLREFAVDVASEDTYIGRIAKYVLRGMTVDEAQCEIAKEMRKAQADERATEERISRRQQTRIGP